MAVTISQRLVWRDTIRDEYETWECYIRINNDITVEKEMIIKRICRIDCVGTRLVLLLPATSILVAHTRTNIGPSDMSLVRTTSQQSQ